MKPVERIWPGETVVIIASGPSLTQADVDWVRGRARVIVINTSYQMAPWADILYACDSRWWRWHKGAPTFTGLKFALTKDSGRWPGVTVLGKTGIEGIETKPHALKTGANSGYQALNLAVHLGVSRAVLLGYDMHTGYLGKEHWHKDHPVKQPSPYGSFLRYFNTAVEPLKALGVEVINCTPKSSLKCFPRKPLVEVFPALDIEAVA